MAESHESAGPDPAARRFRLASPATAAALGALALILMALALALSGLTGNLSVLGSGPIVPVVVVYAAVGVVVARRQPGNPIGWILITFIVMFLLSDVVGAYAALYYRFGHHGLPLAAVAEILQPLWAPGSCCSRWRSALPGRPLAVAALAVGAAGLCGGRGAGVDGRLRPGRVGRGQS